MASNCSVCGGTGSLTILPGVNVTITSGPNGEVVINGLLLSTLTSACSPTVSAGITLSGTGVAGNPLTAKLPLAPFHPLYTSCPNGLNCGTSPAGAYAPPNKVSAFSNLNGNWSAPTATDFDFLVSGATVNTGGTPVWTGREAALIASNPLCTPAVCVPFISIGNSAANYPDAVNPATIVELEISQRFAVAVGGLPAIAGLPLMVSYGGARAANGVSTTYHYWPAQSFQLAPVNVPVGGSVGVRSRSFYYSNNIPLVATNSLGIQDSSITLLWLPR